MCQACFSNDPKSVSKAFVDVTPPAVPHSDGDESASSDVFVSDLIVTPASVLSESSKEFTADLQKDVYHLGDEDVVIRSFVDAASGEGCSISVASVGESDTRTTCVGVKRNLESTFVEIDSDDEPLSLRYGKVKQG